MVLVGLYCTFDGVGVMMMGYHKLEVDTFAVNEIFETDGALVVDNMKDGEETTVIYIGVQGDLGL